MPDIDIADTLIAAGTAGMPARKLDPALLDARRVVWPRGQMNNVVQTDTVGGQRKTLAESRILTPFASVSPDRTKGVRPLFWAGYLGPATGEQSIANDLVLRAAFEANGVTKPITFGGAASATVTAGSSGGALLVLGDPIYPSDFGYGAAADWPTTGFGYSRNAWTCPPGGSIPGYAPGQGTGEGRIFSEDLGAYQVNATGALTTPAGGVSSGQYGPGPVAWLGEWGATKLPSFAILGDSIPDGTGDSLDTGQGITSGGFVVRAIRGNAAVLPWIKLTRASDTYASSLLTSGWFARRHLMRFCTDLIDAMGTNGAEDGGWQVTRYARPFHRTAYQSGVLRIAKTALLPQAASSDGWATAANQTVQAAGGDGARTQTINAMMAASVGLPSGPDYYADTRFPVADIANGLLWRTNGTANAFNQDALHPNAAGHGAMSAPLKVWTDYVRSLY